jgi:hypothetical protein
MGKAGSEMHGQFFDDLAKGLGDGTVSRGRAIKLVGAAFLATMVPSLVPREALAITKKKCHKKGGAYLAKGDCHCAATCNTPATVELHCHSNTSCFCAETVNSTGFCGLLGTFSGCSTSTDCPTGQTCVVERGCTSSGGICTSSAQCPMNYGCVKGRCQATLCAAPCPT